jgi:FkbM family methyltransferase
MRWRPWRKERWFAQRGEDRRLAGLFAGRRRGFYIDVGAWDPTRDSVTKHFYDRGWRGVNVEPHPTYHALLAAERPRDVNLGVALGAERGERSLTLVGASGLATFESAFAESADRWVAANRPAPAQISQIVVEVVTLADVCRQHVPPGTPIDFLKIDVEGWEEQVLRGGDWDAYRPEILVVEAVVPLTDLPAWDSWDGFVRARGYTFLEFDGLNRWYRRSDAARR